jgi:signal-transduction protein with cAMP-binding, CBS, and nucleotidyltransferase domain
LFRVADRPVPMSISRFAQTDVVSVSPETTAAAVARTMKTESVGSVVVVDGAVPIGIVTDRDLVVYVLATDADPRETTARDLMAEDLFTVDAGAGVFSVTGRMHDARVRRVPVTRDGELVGIVTLDDLLVVLAHELGDLAAVVEAERPPGR